MSLPIDFQFNQSNLQDFEICPRRFELRYLCRLVWPAVESEPAMEAERLAELGTDFHHLIHQHLLGLDETILTEALTTAEAQLKVWWRNYLAARPAALAQAHLYPELILSTPLAGYRLLARFDLLAVLADGTFLIVDWKTSARKPAREALAQKMQTRVYPYVLAKAGATLNGGQTIDPRAIQMIYWYAQAPRRPELFIYHAEQQQQDEQYLIDLIERVKGAAQTGHFPLVAKQQPCTCCLYRSWCERGQQAGRLSKTEEAWPEWVDLSALEWEQGVEYRL